MKEPWKNVNVLCKMLNDINDNNTTKTYRVLVNTLRTLTHLVNSTMLLGQYYYFPHFTDEEAEV